MPSYDFRCANGHLHENSFSIHAESRESDCPECGEKTERLVVGVALQLRGGREGWAVSNREHEAREEARPEFKSGQMRRKDTYKWS